MSTNPSARVRGCVQRESGVALLLSIVVLGLLASLAAFALQSTANEWRMAGNEHYRLRALAAAEAAVALGTNALLRAAAGAAPVDIATTAMPAEPGDSYRAELSAVGVDQDVALTSAGALIGTHYNIHAWGKAPRGASVELEADVLVVRNVAGIIVRAERSFWRRLDID